ncbi:SDR family oxidoreductase [Gilvimarinus algae]|uniref:dTDP-4-dehydrorhamnose reductase n=1 Tax=Gilvimarinus algae TaxID=3058037 RepID=A0ABT8TB11_9GAMM|nr:sugar nucleotide-binding protein [Gilvimarinus sp. SDUM040014]MDO3380769.1 sugar nucleotide-binding protein [Gilvimarinus sp. SDUM040014]
MKLLLADSQHSLGVALEHELEREPFNLLQPDGKSLDWADAGAVSAYVAEKRPDLVINNLGWGDSAASAYQTLIPLAAKHLARACAERQVPVIQLSSYRVFGDDNKSKHSERDEPEPNSDLGRAFLAAEQAVLGAQECSLVLRTSWVIGSYGDNLLTRLLSALQDGQPWHLNSRLRGAPTALSDLARVTVALVKQISCGSDCWGVYHYCSGDACSEVEFAEQLAEILRQQDYPVATPQWQVVDETASEVPVSAVLSAQRIRNDFGVQARTWRTYLLPMIKQWMHTNQE